MGLIILAAILSSQARPPTGSPLEVTIASYGAPQDPVWEDWYDAVQKGEYQPYPLPKRALDVRGELSKRWCGRTSATAIRCFSAIWGNADVAVLQTQLSHLADALLSNDQIDPEARHVALFYRAQYSNDPHLREGAMSEILGTSPAGTVAEQWAIRVLTFDTSLVLTPEFGVWLGSRRMSIADPVLGLWVDLRLLPLNRDPAERSRIAKELAERASVVLCPSPAGPSADSHTVAVPACDEYAAHLRRAAAHAD